MNHITGLLDFLISILAVLFSIPSIQLTNGIYIRPPDSQAPSRDIRSGGNSIPAPKPEIKPSAVSLVKNTTSKRLSLSPFTTDQDVNRYLKVYGVDLMLWRCSNAIQPIYLGKPIPFIDLYCEVIGTISSVTWRYNNEIINPERGGRYQQIVFPHYDGGRYFSCWIDFRLRIHNTTRRDSGLYSFTVHSPHGHSDQQLIYVDIGGRKKKRKNQTSPKRTEQNNENGQKIDQNNTKKGPTQR